MQHQTHLSSHHPQEHHKGIHLHGHAPQKHHSASSNQSKVSSGCSYNSFIAPDGNQVWGGALTLAWQNLVKKNEGPIKLSGHQNIADNFNHTKFHTSDLDDASYYTTIGQGQKTVHEINKNMQDKFPDSSFGPLTLEIGPKDLISYAYLKKQIKFNVEFNLKKANEFQFQGLKGKSLVNAFYVLGEQQANQVSIFEFANQDNFVARIGNQGEKDKIFIVMEDKNLDMVHIINKVMEIEKIEPERFDLERDEFVMPVLDFDYERNYEEMIGLAIINEKSPLHNFRFAAVVEKLKLKIDEKGAKVENMGYFFMNECSIMGIVSKKMILNKPFWVLMKEEKKHPYICLHINNL